MLSYEEAKQFDQVELKNVFNFVDNIIDAYTKSKNSNVNYQYILINMLKTIKDIETPISVVKIDNSFVDEKQEVVVETNNFKIDEVEPKHSFETNQSCTNVHHDETTQTLEQPINNSEPEIKNFYENKVEPEISDEPIIHNFADKTINNSETEFVSQMVLMNQEMKDQKFNFKISSEKILEVIATASKEDRIMVEDKFKEVNANPQLKNNQLFLPFIDSKVKASNKECFVIVPDIDEVSKWINWKMQNKDYRDNLSEFLGFKKIIICITKEQWQQLKNEFMFRKSQNTLPTTSTITDEENYYHSIVVPENVDDITKKLFQFLGKTLKWWISDEWNYWNFKRIWGYWHKGSQKNLFEILTNQSKKDKLIKVISEISEKFSFCERCFYYKKENYCDFCDQKKRNQNQMCVVSYLTDAQKYRKAIIMV
ncbi:hypothetical protein [Spiroplasma clarkii]|uniref:hypothetical protein n=1 Tax=Spiroplasma clarkii TaxID=2139 RepID=UPI0011BA8230|nr:hypothetical protein [Spiroplasma clarkii]